MWKKRANTLLFGLILITLLTSCKPGVAAPEATGSASPEAVALSLSTVDPEESLHLFEYDPSAPLDIQEEKRWHEGNGTWIDFTYASPKGGRVQARLVIPDGKGPFPGIILQHGGTGSLEDMTPFAQEFVGYGAVTMMITDPYRRPGGWKITQYMGNTWPIFNDRDLEIKIQLIIDLRRAIDLLSSRPEVDPERLAYYGVSFGGAMGGLLAGVEDRLVAYVLVVGDGGLVEHTSDPSEDGLNIHFSENWAARMWPTESLHFVGRAAPAALLFQNGIHDTYVPPRDAIRYQTAASEPKTIIWYNAGHGLPWQAVVDAARWLQPFLGERLFLLAPNYRASAVLMDRTLIVFVLLVLGVYLWETARRKYLGWGDGILWLLAIVLMGPVGLVIYWITTRRRSDAGGTHTSTPTWKQALGITALITTALVVGLFLGDKINDTMPTVDFRLRLLQLYLTTLIVGWLLSLLARRTYRAFFSSFILAANLFWVMVMLGSGLFGEFFRSASWVIYPANALIGVALTFPLHIWMLRHGLERWILLQESEAMPPSLMQYPLLLTIGLLALSFFLALGSVFVMVQLVTGLPWKEVMLIMRGVYQ